MGALVGNKCFDTAADAADAYFSQTPPVLLTGGYFWQFVKTASGWQLNYYKAATNGQTLITTTKVTIPAFPACNPAQSFSDGALVGSSLGAAIILIAAVKFLLKARVGL